MKKSVLNKISIISIMLTMQLMACGNPETELEETAKIADIIELQSDEIEILSKMYVNEEHIQNGNLFSYQRDNLERYRYAKVYLLEKYPDYTMEIIYGEPKSKLMPQAEFTFVDKEGDGKNYTVYIYNSEDNNGYYAEDNFYEAIIADKYDECVQDALQQKVNNVEIVISTMPWPKGKEYDSNLKIEDITSGKVELSANTSIYIVDNIMTEDIFQNIVSEIKEIICSNHFYGSFKVYAYDGTYSADILRKEGLRPQNYIFKATFQNFRED